MKFKQSKFSVKAFLLSNVDLIVITFFLIIKLQYFNVKVLSGAFYYGTCLVLLGSILPIVAISCLLGKWKPRYLLIVDILLSILLLIDAVYFKYFKDLLSLGSLSNSFLLGGVSASVKQLISISDFIYILDIIIYFPLIKLYKRYTKGAYGFKPGFCLFLILFISGAVSLTMSISRLSKDQPRLLSTMYSKVYIGKVLGPVTYHVLDAYNYTATSLKHTKITDERVNEIKTFLDSEPNKVEKKLTGAGKDKNLIMIQVEALQQFPINATINGNEITPNLNRWIKKSLYFDNYFYQVAAGNTSDAEFMSNNSLYPAESGASYYRYVGDTLDSLPKQLKGKGYYTAALHGYTEGFWNRMSMYKTEDFDDFFGESSFNLDEKVGMGLSDKSFLSQSLEKLQSFKKPYYSFLITLSSHFPYDDAKGYGSFDVGQYENTLMGNYLRGIHYTDAQLGMYLDALDEAGITKDSIIVLYGDHNAIPNSNAEELYSFLGIENPTDLNWYEQQKVPMFIHFPGDENSGVNHTYSGQMDLYPTLANIFDFSPDYALGKDILNSDNQEVLFRNGSFTDGSIFYIASTNTYYNVGTGQTVSESPELLDKKQNAEKMLSYSDDILNHNLIKKFESMKPPADKFTLKQSQGSELKISE